MIDYIFFDDGLMNRFTSFLRQRGVEHETDTAGKLVQLPEDLDDDLLTTIEDEYDLLLSETEQLLEETGDALEKNLAAVRVELSSGQACNIKFSPDILGRLLQVMSVDELQEMVQNIARAVENPSDKPICHL